MNKHSCRTYPVNRGCTIVPSCLYYIYSTPVYCATLDER